MKISAYNAVDALALADVIIVNDMSEAGNITRKTTIGDVLLLAWPVGSIYLAIDEVSPVDKFGGEWSVFGAGRMPVGLDSGDGDFDVAEETGGAKTHTLTSAEMPAHTHTQDAHTHTQNSHVHAQQRYPTATGGLTGFTVDTSMSGTEAAANNTAAATATNQNATATNQNTGGGGAHNNLPPFIVVRMWKRTA
jgi:microcystin-dependent protein